MQLALNQLDNHLAKGLRSLYVLHGDEPLLQQEAMDAIRAAARQQGYTERSSYTVAGAHFDWSAVLAAGGSLSLFADKQILEVRIPSGKPGKEGGAALQQLASSAQGNDSTLTLISLPRLDKATRTGAWFSALDAQGVTIQVEPIERGALPHWMAVLPGAGGGRAAAGWVLAGKGCAATDTGRLDFSHVSAGSTRKIYFAQGDPVLPSGYVVPEKVEPETPEETADSSLTDEEAPQAAPAEDTTPEEIPLTDPARMTANEDENPM